MATNPEHDDKLDTICQRCGDTDRLDDYGNIPCDHKVEEEYDDGQGRSYDILDEELQ